MRGWERVVSSLLVLLGSSFPFKNGLYLEELVVGISPVVVAISLPDFRFGVSIRYLNYFFIGQHIESSLCE